VCRTAAYRDKKVVGVFITAFFVEASVQTIDYRYNEGIL
jgi:hypothetical protein